MIRVLYIDDEPALLDLAKEYLETSPDITVETATSAPDGLCRLREGGVDAVVSDYLMPEMDGLAFLKEVRNNGDRTPFVLFTGKGREEVVIEALNSGADFYLQKGGDPVPMYAELVHKVRLAVERRRTDEALRASERRFRQVLESLPVGLWLADRDGTLILGNPVGQRIWEANPHVGQDGYGVFKAWRLPSHEPVRPDDWALGHAVNEGVATENELLEIEAFNGVHKYVLNWAIPTKGDGGEITGAFVINQDITPMVKAEAALREGEERYRTLIRHCSDAVFCVSPDETYRFVNETLARTFGRRPEEVVGLCPLVLFPEPQGELMADHVRQVFRTGRKEVREMAITDHEGREMHCLTVLDPVLDEGGSVRSVFGISKDITERKRTEDALRKSEETNRAILEHAGIGLGYWSTDGRLIYLNSLAASNMGGGPGDFVGKTVAELFGPERAAEHAKRIAEAIASPTAREYEDQVNLGSGPEWFLFIYSRVLDASGKVVGVQILSHEITERKRMEAALRDTNRKLNLLSNITMHDISNQLQAMTTSLELARAQGDRQRADQLLAKALTCGDRIAAMIRFTRDYESIGLLAPSWLNVRMVVDRAWSGVPHEVRLRNDADAAYEVYADSLIGKVFYNLLDNAVNHGGNATTVRCCTEPAGDGLRIVVEDDGIGVMHHDKERIFERGYGKNHGLGLFLVREILGITGITIRENGQPFRGARFEMAVPRDAFRRVE